MDSSETPRRVRTKEVAGFQLEFLGDQRCIYFLGGKLRRNRFKEAKKNPVDLDMLNVRFLSYVQMEKLRRQLETGVRGPENKCVRHQERVGAQGHQPERTATGDGAGGTAEGQALRGRGEDSEDKAGEAARGQAGRRRARSALWTATKKLGRQTGVTGSGGLAVTGG